MKRTAYQIEGQSFTEPKDLPDGFTVKRVEVDDPKRIRVSSSNGTRDLVVQRHAGTNSVTFARMSGDVNLGTVAVSQDSARKVRDCLNAILGDVGKPVMLTDDSGDFWVQRANGLFDCGTALTGYTRDQVAAEFGPVKEVTL